MASTSDLGLADTEAIVICWRLKYVLSAGHHTVKQKVQALV